MTDFPNPIYSDENKAREHLEAIRWPDGPYCPFCGQDETVKPLGGKSMGLGWYHCSACREKFTIRVGTVYERSKIPLHKWLLATHLLCASKKGMSAHQMHRMLGLTYKTAWFMVHRIREAMKDEAPAPMGGPGGSVQADETYFGHKAGRTHERKRKGKAMKAKRAVVCLISGGKARTFQVASANGTTVRNILVQNVRRESELHTDESPVYTRVGEEYSAHRTVHHTSGEYVRDGVSTNKVENYFSIFKRGMKGVYQHCAEKHLQRYINEFDFRYNTREIADSERRDKALAGAEGKRLTYRRTDQRANV